MFKDKSVISSIPTYFEIKESPFICNKYNNSNKGGKDQEYIQSSTTADPGYNLGK